MTSEEAIAYLERADTTVYAESKTRTAEALEMAIEALKERKPGKWIRTKRGLLCSACRSGVKNQPLLMGKPLFLYCPFCGVKVEGVDDES